MSHLDHRLARILSDVRLEQAEAIRRRKRVRYQKQGVRHSLGLLLIAQGERLVKRQARAA